MSTGTWIWICTIAMCAGFLVMAFKQKDKAEVSFSNYAIGAGTIPFILIFFTNFANIMGVGNFVGHAGSAYVNGLPWLAFILGEQGSKVLFALTFAVMAGKLSYNTFPEMIDDLITRDKVTRALAGLLASCIMIAWVGGQGKGIGEIFKTFTGTDPLPIIILFTIVFILYTTMGGIYSLLWMDLVLGIICLVFGLLFYAIAFKEVNFSIPEIGRRLAETGQEQLWTFAGTDTTSLLSKFVTGCVGILVAQLYWQPSFAAKGPKTARNGMLLGGSIAIVYVILTAFVGMIIATLHQGLDANTAMTWFMQNKIPSVVAVMIFVLILAAGMSSADSNLNSASVLITNDLIRPFKPDLNDKQLIKLTRILTVIVGIFAALGAIFASSIMALFSRAYSMAGAGLVPLLLVGLLWKEEKDSTYRMGKRNSKVTAWGARVGIVVGAVLSQLTGLLGPNAVLWALLVSAVTIVVVSILTRNVKIAPNVTSPGFVGVNPKEAEAES